MIEFRVPSDVETNLQNAITICKGFHEVSDVDSKKKVLKLVRSTIMSLLKKRGELLQKEGYSESCCINLVTVERMPQLQKNYVVIKIGDTIAPIKIAEGTVIADNYDGVLYSINKYGKTQQIEHASPFDVELYRVLIAYKTLRANFIKDNPVLCHIYKAGDRIEITKFRGIYRITHMTENAVYISCKKWEMEGRRPMLIHRSEIKNLAKYEL